MKIRTSALALMLAGVLSAMAETPTISLHSESYDLYGEEGIFTLLVGSTQPGEIRMDCGFGAKTYEITPAVFDAETGEMTGTYLTCQTSAAGNVKIYAGEGVEIDYLNAEGCEITSIEFSKPEDFDMLYLRHNSIASLDLSAMTNLTILDLGDNPFDESPLVVGPNKPNLRMLAIDMVSNLSQSFDLRDYPSLYIFSAYDTPSLKFCDPTGCPDLVQLSIDNTRVEALDISHNQSLRILNISDTGIRHIDLTNNPGLTEFYCNHQSDFSNTDVKLSSIDLSNNPNLVYLFLSGNNLTNIDISNNLKLQDFYIHDNYLTDIDLSNHDDLVNVSIARNYLDFATLPFDEGWWLTYEYQQRPIPVPKSYRKGEPLNFADKVLRDTTETFAWLLMPNPDDPASPIQLDESAFEYADGVIRINTIPSDSVYIEFYNPWFPGCLLRTTNFVVKDEEYGKPEMAFAATMLGVGIGDMVEMSIGVEGAAETKPKKVFADMGDGMMQEFVAVTSGLPDTPNIVAAKAGEGKVKVYVEDGETLTAIGIEGVKLNGFDVSSLRSLAELSLKGTGLYYIDLSWNRNLRKLILNGNHFGADFTLEGVNGAYIKTALEYIDLSGNEMTEFSHNTNESIRYLDLSNNLLTSYNFTEAERVYYLDISNNNFEYVKLNYLSSLLTLDVSGNNLSEMVLPETNIIEYFRLDGNKFTLDNMPSRGELGEDDFIYAPQQKIEIVAKAPKVSLASQDVTIDGYATEFAWYTVEGEQLEPGVDYTITDGVTEFLEPADGKTVYCSITNGAYPAFAGENALMTTPVTVSGTPDQLIGQFVTLKGGRTVNLSLASHVDNDVIYIDWAGDGELTEYVLGTTYRLFQAKSVENALVKIYSYDENSQLSVFSMGGVALSNVDFSNMHNLELLSLTNAEINDLVMPQSPGLKDIAFAFSAFTDFDFSAYPDIASLSFDNNKFTSVDLAGLNKLQSVNFSNNSLEEITFGDNPQLWSVFLPNNKLTSIDLSPLSALYQVILDNNQLESINIDGLEWMRVLSIGGNRFTFATLPLPHSSWGLYSYGNQAAIQVECVDGQVDLSSQAVVDGIETSYHWSVGEPYYDAEEGGLVSNWLVEGEDFLVADGCTIFTKDFEGVMCVMLNDLFPSAYMKTNLINVTSSLADAVAAGDLQAACDWRGLAVKGAAGEHVSVFTIDGRKVASGVLDANGEALFADVPSGVLIVKGESAAVKAAAK